MSTLPRDQWNLFSPIPPLPPVAGWQDVRIEESGEPLIALDKLDHSRVISLSAYFKSNFQAAQSTLYVRETVADLLLSAARQLPKGLCFAVFDAWRSTDLQKEIFSRYRNQLKSENPQLSEGTLIERTKMYVSAPTRDPRYPAPHLTGGAVDLTLCDQRGDPLRMGTAFDYFGPEAGTRYFEETATAKKFAPFGDSPLANRRLLFNVLSQQGFTNYPEEWWHFDYGNQFWGRIKNKHALYGVAEPPSS